MLAFHGLLITKAPNFESPRSERAREAAHLDISR